MTNTGRTGLSGWLTPTTFVGILLLATLAVVLGAMVLIQPDDGPAEEPPSLSFVINETHNTLRVNSTDDSVSWRHLQVALDRPGMFMVEGDENRSTAEPLVFQRISNGSTIEEGDRLRFCVDNGAGELEVRLRHADTSRVIDTFLFAEMDSCDPADPEEPEAPEEGGENETGDNETDDNMTDELPDAPENITARPAAKRED